MYPDLSYLFHDLFGSAPDNFLSIFKMFGFVLALAFLTSAVVYYAELRRKAKEGLFKPTKVQVVEGRPASVLEILINALIGFILLGKGFYANQHYDEFRHNPAEVILSGKVHLVAALFGALLLGAYTWWEAWRKRKTPPVVQDRLIYPHDRISEMTVAAAIGGIVGAKVFDLFDNWKSFLEDPAGALLSGGGLAFYGGLILGFIAVVWYIHRHKIPFLHAADAVAPSLTAGYGVGRIGCQLAGDGDWGLANLAPKPGWMSFLPDWMWAFDYPHNVLRENTPIDGCSWDYCMKLAEPVYPTPFYEVIMMAIVFAILWSLRKRIHVPGMLFFIYLGLIAIERFLIEKIRINVHYDVLGMRLSQAEIISIILFLISVAGIVYVRRRANNVMEEKA